jgi:diguanylate cyclase (GGDEF)-like protein/PAS domain S-box-containing protein
MEPINMTASDYAWSLIDHCAIPIVGQTLCGDVITWNPAAEQLFGYRPKEILGRSALLLVPPDRLQEQEELFAAIGAGEVVTEFDTVRLRADGISTPVTLTLSPVRDWSSRIIGVSSIVRPRRKAPELIRTLYRAAYHDPLTDVLNRTGLQRAVAPDSKSRGAVAEQRAVFFIDLDGFKLVNDSAGHQAGDEVLRSCGRRLLAAVRSADAVCRWGGDEFVVVLKNLPADRACAKVVTSRIGETLLQSLRQPYSAGGRLHACSPSIGACLYSTAELRHSAALQLADRLMYAIKRSGKNNIEIGEYPPTPIERIPHRLALTLSASC